MAATANSTKNNRQPIFRKAAKRRDELGLEEVGSIFFSNAEKSVPSLQAVLTCTCVEKIAHTVRLTEVQSAIFLLCLKREAP